MSDARTPAAQPEEHPAPTAAEMIAVVDDPEADPELTPAADPTQGDPGPTPRPRDNGDAIIDAMIERARKDGAPPITVGDRHWTAESPPVPARSKRTAADLIDYAKSLGETPEGRAAYGEFLKVPATPIILDDLSRAENHPTPVELAEYWTRMAVDRGGTVRFTDAEGRELALDARYAAQPTTKRPISDGAERLLGVKAPVLGEGYVALVDYLGNDESVVRAARMSYGEGTRSLSDDAALTEYLILHRHTSPLEAPTLEFLIQAPIFVARQFYTHRASSRTEVSYRYSEVPEGFYLPDVADMHAQDTKNRQGRGVALGSDAAAAARNVIERANRHSQEAYHFLAVGTEQGGWGVAREIARQVQPVAAWTVFRWKQDLHNLLHFLSLRLKPNAQLETRRYAEAIADVVAEAFPVVWAAWYEHVFAATTLSSQTADSVARLLYLLSQGKANSSGWRLLTEARERLPKRQRAQFDALLAQGEVSADGG